MFIAGLVVIALATMGGWVSSVGLALSVVGNIIGFALAFVGLVRLFTSSEAIRRRQTEVGTLICTRCEQPLRGATDGRCPECGTPFDQDANRTYWAQW